MKLIKEPLEIDLQIKSKNWSEKDLADFREMMIHLKNKNKYRRSDSVEIGKIHQMVTI